MANNTVVIKGYSDDIICIKGIPGDQESDLEAFDRKYTDILFSEGTVLRITYSVTGEWKIEIRHKSKLTEINIVPSEGEDSPNYSDVATLKGPITCFSFFHYK